MKSTLILATLTILVSCGPNVKKEYFLNDDAINAKLADHEERITLLEQLPDRMNALEDLVIDMENLSGVRFEALNDFISEFRSNLSDLSNGDLKELREDILKLKIAMESMDVESMEILPICNSREHVIRSKGELFAVISSVESVNITFKDCFNNSEKNCNDRIQEVDQVSNVHLGKLTQGNYKLTDGSNITFSVNNNEIVNCKGEL